MFLLYLQILLFYIVNKPNLRYIHVLYYIFIYISGLICMGSHLEAQECCEKLQKMICIIKCNAWVGCWNFILKPRTCKNLLFI